jgi:predicted transcriptional regulator
MTFRPNQQAYQDLNTILSILDTNLKIATIVELQRNPRRSAPEIADVIHNAEKIKAFREDLEKAPRKRTESVKVTLDEMADGTNGETLLARYKADKRSYQMPEALYDFLKTRLVAPTIDIAYLAIRLVSNIETPVHHLWGAEGGSFSPALKHLQTGIPLTTFYGVTPFTLLDSVDSGHWNTASPTTLTGCELADTSNLNKEEKRHLITKLGEYGFIQREENIGANAWRYSLSEKGKQFVENFFVPALHRVKNLTDSKQHWKIQRARNLTREYFDEIAKLRDIHYAAFAN